MVQIYEVGLIRRNTKLLFVLVLPVYFYIIQSSILNKHTHFYPNGFVVTHSHTLDLNGEEPINKHNHNQTEICLYCNLDIELHTISMQDATNFNYAESSRAYLVEDVRSEYITLVNQLVPRGPPFLIL